MKNYMNNKKTGKATSFWLAACIMAVTLTGITRPADAALFDSLIPGSGINFFEDVDRDAIIDIDGSGSITPGDIFIGWARIDDRSIPTPGIHFAPEEVYGIFSITVTSVDTTDNGDGTSSHTIEFGETTMPGLDLDSLTGVSPLPSGSAIAIYENIGLNLVAQSPGDFNGDSVFNVLDFISKIAAAQLDIVSGFGDVDDHWKATFSDVPAAADPVANLSALESATLAGGIPGRNSFHAGLSVLVNNHPTISFADFVEDFSEFPTVTLHEFTVQNGDISGASDIDYDSLNPLFGSITVGGSTYDMYGASTNADYGALPFIDDRQTGACRMTGGNATVYPIEGTDGNPTWSYQFVGPDEGERVTTGGQINAPSGNNPVSGHWEHTLHGGADGTFSFHAGTTSAPEGTEISTVECADPGWCVAARCAPFKQLFWTGVGNFANQHFDYDFGSCNVVKGNRGTTHYVRVMIGDFGENKRPTRELSLIDNDPLTCNWPAKLPGGAAPGPWTAEEAVYLDSVADDKFGDKGGQVCDACPDYYQIEIYCGNNAEDPGEVIYQFAGFLGGGNYQIHPETGEQCPAVEELVPELFETSTDTNTDTKPKPDKAGPKK